MLKDLFSAVQKSLSDRVRDPLLGSVTVFFFIWNWKPITLLLFGSFGGFEDRLRYVQELYLFPKADMWGEYGPYWGSPEHLGAWCWSLFWNYGAPLAWTLAYLWIYPWVKRQAVMWWQEQETKTINAKRERERAITISPEESARLQRELDRLRDELAKAQRGKYSLQSMNYWVCKAAAQTWKGQVADFAVTFAAGLERRLVQEGHWLVHDPKSNDAWFYDGRWEDHWQACLVVALLDGPLLLVKKAGTVDWASWAKKTHTVLSDSTWYALDDKHAGRIRPANTQELSEWEATMEVHTQAPRVYSRRVRQACVGFADDDAQITIEVPR
jgi:hypothetical protein